MGAGEPRASGVPTARAHGAEIPVLGLGTWQLEGSTAERITRRALELGYRHVDTARAYGNEAEVGRALEASDVDRSEVFLTTKIWPTDYSPSDFRRAVGESLRRLRTDPVDLLLLHWPRFQEASLEEVVGALVEARREGRTRHIGVCNFNSELLERAWAASDALLVTNQVEYHPYLTQETLLKSVRDRGMVLTAYSPLAHGRVPGDRRGSGLFGLALRWAKRLRAGRPPWGDPLTRVARRHGKTPVQVTLRWLTQHDGVVAIPRTSDPDHLRENLEIFDFELSDAEMRDISGLARPDGRIIDPPDLAPEWD